MGAPTTTDPPVTTALPIWTSLRRLLSTLGIPLVDPQRLAQLSAPLIRLRLSRRWLSPAILAFFPTPWHADEPLAWVCQTHSPFESTLFRIHFDTSDQSAPDRARISVASLSESSASWLVVNSNSGCLELAHSPLAATVFTLRPHLFPDRMHIALHAACTAGRYLSIHEPSHRARVCSLTSEETPIEIEHVALPASLQAFSRIIPQTVLECLYNSPLPASVRLQNVAHRFFLAAKPHVCLSAARSKDSGWDAFTLEFDAQTNSALLRDARGHYLRLTDRGDGVISSGDSPTPHKPERFYITRIHPQNHLALRTRKGYLSARRSGRIVISQNTVPGRDEFFRLCVALPSMVDQRSPRLRLFDGEHGLRIVEASVMVPVDARLAFEVLTDYEGFKTFIKDASESGVVERRNDRELTVRMVQCHSFLMLSVPMSMTLDVVESPDLGIVTMNLNKGLGVRAYKGEWQALQREDGRSVISCKLSAATSVPAPTFLTDGLMSHATSSTLVQLRAECIRRAAVLHQQSTGSKSAGRPEIDRSVLISKT